MAFTDKQLADLTAKLDASHVKARKQAGRSVDYIEGWHAIAEANRIFGFDAWDRATVEMTCVSDIPRKIGDPSKGPQKDGWGVTYTARVRVTVRVAGANVTRDGVGAGHGIDVDPGQAHESAIKEAETDAMKRALMTFGNPFGLALYDKTKENVEAAPPRQQAPARQQPAGIDEARQKAVAFKDEFMATIRKARNFDELSGAKNSLNNAKAIKALHDRHHDLWTEIMAAISKRESDLNQGVAA